MKNHHLFMFVAALLLIMTACTTDTKAITIEDAWVRASVTVGADMPAATAAYMRIVNGSKAADRLIGVESPAARVAEIHQTTMENDVASMQHMPMVEIPAGGEVEFKPGSYHIMMMELQQPLTVGDRVEIVLVFESSGKIVVEAVVKE